MVKTTSTCPTIRTSAAGAAAKPIYQQAEPSAESSPTWLELRQVRNMARSVSRSRNATQSRCKPVWIAMTTTSVTSADPIRSTPSSSAVASFTAIAASANIDPAPRPQSAAGWPSARQISRVETPRPASASTSTPATPATIPIHASSGNRSPRKSAVTSAACTASVLEKAVPTTKPRCPNAMMSRIVPAIWVTAPARTKPAKAVPNVGTASCRIVSQMAAKARAKGRPYR